MPLTTAFATLPPVTSPPTTLPGETTTAPPGQPSTYTVQSGDYLYGIAKAHGVSADEIVAVNGWSNANHMLTPGEDILLPASAAVTPVTVPNALPNATAPLPSDLLPDTTAPAAGATPASNAPTSAAGGSVAPGGSQSYTVKNGDTVYGIAKKFKIVVQLLVAANGWSDVGHPLYPGDVIVVPAPAG